MRRLTRRKLTPVIAAVAATAAVLSGCSSNAGTGADVDLAGASGSTTGVANGVSSFFSTGRKDCVGTAQNTTSKVWYTVSDGILSDIYGATVDISNLQSLQYIVTGTGFTELQSNLNYTTQVDAQGMTCTVTSTSTNGYTITTTYVTDPTTNSVVMNSVLGGANAANVNVFVRTNSAVNGNGGGQGGWDGSGSPAAVNGNQGGAQGYNMGPDSTAIDSSGAVVHYDTNTSVAALNASYMKGQYLAVLADQPFVSPNVAVGVADPPNCATSCNDPATPLLNNGGTSLTNSTTGPQTVSTTSSGNATSVAQINTNGGTGWRLAVGLDTSQSAAVTDAQTSIGQSFSTIQSNYTGTWTNYQNGINQPTIPSSAGLTTAQANQAEAMYVQAINTVKAAEDKTFPGALGAGLAIPWGQSVPAGQNQQSNSGSASWGYVGGGYSGYYGSYREVFARDASQSATALLNAGDTQTAQDVATFLLTKQQLGTGQIPRNSLPNGQPAPDSGAMQIDESGFPILLAYQSGLHTANPAIWSNVSKAADWIVANGPSGTGQYTNPCFANVCSQGVERWEEQTGFSPSSVAAAIAGLTAASAIGQAVGDTSGRIQHYQAAADNYQAYLQDNAVVTDPSSVDDADYSGVGSYYMRVVKTDTSETTDYSLGNGITAQQNQQVVIDPGFLELVRLGALPAGDANVANTVKLIDSWNPTGNSGTSLGANVGATVTTGGPTGYSPTAKGITATGYHRYGTASDNIEDGYGDCITGGNSNCGSDGAPWAPTGNGIGHIWPLLNGERGEYYVANSNMSGAGKELIAMMTFAGNGGLMPEQVWSTNSPPSATGYGTNPLTASIGFQSGQPAGSAMPLTWATAQFARLVNNISSGKNLDTSTTVSGRYAGAVDSATQAPPTLISGNFPAASPLVSSPGASTSTNGCSPTAGGGTVTVNGSTAPGATVVAQSFDKPSGNVTLASATADGTTGDFSFQIATTDNTTLTTSAQGAAISGQTVGQTALNIAGMC